MATTLEKLLEKRVKELTDCDLSIITYVCNIFQEALDGKLIFTELDVYNTLYTPLMTYSIAKNDQEAYDLCYNFFQDLIASKIVTDPKDLKKQTLNKLKKNDDVMAQYSVDGQWYYAKVSQITDTEVHVVYRDYGNEEWVDPLQIQLIDQITDSKLPNVLKDRKHKKNKHKNNNDNNDNKQDDINENGDNNNNDNNADNDNDKNNDGDEEKKFSDEMIDGKKGFKLGDVEVMDDVTAKINNLMYKQSRFLTDTKRDDKDLAEFGLTSRQKKKLKEEEKEKEKVARFDPKRYLKSMRQKARPEWLDPNKRKAGLKDIYVYNYTMQTLDDQQTLLEDAEIKFTYGVRYGFVGLNGAGKTTLLRRLSRYDIPNIPGHLRILHVEQEIMGDDTTVIDYVLSCDVVRVELLQREKNLIEEKNKSNVNQDEISTKFTQLYELMANLDVINVEPRAREVLSGLGFTAEMMEWPTKKLSGGWRMRVSLAGALFVKPDILLLDEPTNHLDFPSVVWLENYLVTFEGTLICVSHDREFLNNVAQIIMYLNKRKLVYFKGDFKTFIDTTKRKYEQQLKDYEAQQANIAHIKEFIDRFRYNANRAALVQSRIKTLQNMERIERPDDVFTMKFVFPPCAKIDGTVVQLTNVTFGYNSKQILLNGVDINLDQKSRVGIIGANGAGKSTLIHLMLGKLQPLFGEVNINRKCRIGLFTQHHMDQLDLSKSPLDFLSDLFPEDCRKVQRPAELIRNKLGQFGLSGDVVTQRMVFLSGGQKSRVALTVLTWKDPNFIIMDEPTNHLDVETIEALIDAINQWNGGLLIVSHDQHFLSSVAKEFWALAKGNGRIKRYKTLDEAKKFALSE